MDATWKLTWRYMQTTSSRWQIIRYNSAERLDQGPLLSPTVNTCWFSQMEVRSIFLDLAAVVKQEERPQSWPVRWTSLVSLAVMQRCDGDLDHAPSCYNQEERDDGFKFPAQHHLTGREGLECPPHPQREAVSTWKILRGQIQTCVCCGTTTFLRSLSEWPFHLI